MAFLSSIDLWRGVNDAATTLVTLAAGATQSVHDLEASDPLVASAITLAEHEVPGLTQAVGIAQAVVAFAQVVAHATTAAAATAGAPASAPAPASAASAA